MPKILCSIAKTLDFYNELSRASVLFDLADIFHHRWNLSMSMRLQYIVLASLWLGNLSYGEVFISEINYTSILLLMKSVFINRSCIN